MIDTNPVRRWMRELGQLRGRVVRQGQNAPCSELAQEALGMCDSLLRDLAGAHTACDALRAELQDRAAAATAFFELLPVAAIVTDSSSTIVSANEAASALLNTNIRRLKSRELIVYAEEREAFLQVLRHLGHNGDDRAQTMLRFRPRERKPREISLTVAPLPGAPPGLWLWFLQPALDRTLLGVLEGTQQVSPEPPQSHV